MRLRNWGLAEPSLANFEPRSFFLFLHRQIDEVSVVGLLGTAAGADGQFAVRGDGQPVERSERVLLSVKQLAFDGVPDRQVAAELGRLPDADQVFAILG